MKKIKDFHGYLNLICLLIIDLLIFLVPKNYDYNIQFWIGFVFIQLPFVGYSLTKFLVNNLLLSESIHYAFLIYIISKKFPSVNNTPLYLPNVTRCVMIV